MKPLILKFVALIAFLTGSFSLSAQKLNPSFAIDKNITSFEVANLVDKVIYEHLPTPGYGSPNAFSPHYWRITLIMAEGTDVTKLAPTITLASGATITSKYARVQDFSQPVDYTVIAEDGSTVTYKFLAYAQEQRRREEEDDDNQLITIYCDPSYGGTTDPEPVIDHNHNENNFFHCEAYPAQGYQFDYWEFQSFWYGRDISYDNPFTGILNGSEIIIYAIFRPAAQYYVTLHSEDTNRGTVSGEGSCYEGGSITISALPKPGYTFEGWYRTGSKISGNAHFDYSPSSSGTLIAKFKMIGSISGPGIICSGTSFSATAGGSFSWDKSPNLQQSGSGSSVSFSGTSNGTGWIRILDNFNNQEIARVNVWVGAPSITISGDLSIPANSGTTFYASQTNNNVSMSITGYEWVISPVSNTLFDFGSYASAHFTAEGIYRVSCRAMNSCGTGSWADHYITVGDPSPSPSSVYPNPVSDILNIDAGSTVNATARNASVAYDIRLYSMMGSLLRQTDTNGNMVQISVSDLPNGIYFLHIYDGASSTPEIHKIIVKH